MWRILFIITLVTLVGNGYGANIFAPIPFAGNSHMIFFNALFQELAKRGHEVTVITPFPSKEKIENFNEIDFKLNLSALSPFTSNNETISTIDMLMNAYKLIMHGCLTTLTDPRVQPFLKGEKKVDLILSSMMFCECHLVFADIYKNAPLIQMAPFVGIPSMFQIYGNPIQLAVNADPLSSNSNEMNLIQRTLNFIQFVLFQLFRYLIYFPSLERELKQQLDIDMNLKELDNRGSLLFLNTENVLGNPRAYSANVIPVGGMQIKKPKPLQAELKNWLDESKDGVIYFSLGSAIKGIDLPEEKRKAILNVFKELKERILWKWENDVMPDKPENVRIEKWLPQKDLLAHPKIKAFIMQGGQLSSQEAIYHGIPIIGIPILGDQKYNMVNSVSKGFAISLSFDNITETSLGWALDEILNNPTYRENAKRLSILFKDKPMEPLEKAVYWTEYVLRHNGAPHLNNPARYLSWYQRELLDVYLLLIIIITISFWIIIRLSRFIFKCCIKRKRKID